MSYIYKILKQFLPAQYDASDPLWAKRQIWVAKLNQEDTIDEFETLEQARVKRNELDQADPTNRVYKIIQIDLKGNEPNTDIE
jgi:hypothetical protein